MDKKRFDANDAATIRRLKNVRLVASDLDGTFLSKDHTVSDKNKDAVSKLEAVDRKFIIATGRNRYSADGIVGNAFDLKKRAGVYINGAVAYDKNGNLIHERRIPPRSGMSIIKYVQMRSDIAINIVSYDKYFSPDIKEEWAMHLHEKYDDPKPEPLKRGYNTYVEELPPLHMIHIISDPYLIDTAWSDIVQICEDEGLYCARNLPTDIAVSHPEATKSFAVSTVAKKLFGGLEMSKHVLTLGDSGNDVEMVRDAFVGVAMQNAREELKRVADIVSNGNDDNLPGVAQILYAVVAAAKNEEGGSDKKRSLEGNSAAVSKRSKVGRDRRVIYEVNIEVDKDVAESYRAWLVPHMKEMLTIDGFEEATLADVESLPSGGGASTSGRLSMVATYRVSSREKLQEYFDVHAARLRGDGVNRFKGRFQCTRRIHTHPIQIQV